MAAPLMEPPAPVFALGAHSDDLAFSLAAAFHDGPLAGCRPVTVFSRSAWTLDSAVGDECAVSALRKSEDLRFFARTRAGEPLWLEQRDAPLRGEGDRVFTAPARRDDVAAVCAALRAILPASGTLLVPLALGRHVDHRLVLEAGCALRAEGWRTVFYEDLPYAAFMDEGEIAHEVGALGRRLGKRLLPRFWTSPRLMVAKARAVRSYPSQTDRHFLGHLVRHARRVRQGRLLAERVWVCAGDESATAG